MRCSVSFFFSINPSEVRNAAISCIPGSSQRDAPDKNDIFFRLLTGFASQESLASSFEGSFGSSFDSSTMDSLESTSA